MEGAPHGLDALMKFSTEQLGKMVRPCRQEAGVGPGQCGVEQGWVARIQHAVQQVVPVVHDVREQWNLLAAYELYTGTLLNVSDLVFMLGELERHKPEILVKRPDQYMVAYMKLLLGKRHTVENPPQRRRLSRSPGCDAGGDRRDCGLQWHDAREASHQSWRKGRSRGNPPQDLAGRTDVPMDEDGTTASMELLPLQEEPLGLNKYNLRRIRKRKGAPMWVHRLSKMVETMAKNIAEEVPMGVP